MAQLLRMVVFSTVFVFFSSGVWAGTIPDCLKNGSALSVDNQAVIDFKNSTSNQFLARAHVSGVLTKIYGDQTGHSHFAIQIGPDSKDTLEVVYNISFGKLPVLHSGMVVEACGDFINASAPTSQYPASPDGAIIHWVHKNPSPKGHESGYVVIDGLLFGQGQTH